MSDYTVSRISPTDKRAVRQMDALLEKEGIERDKNLDYSIGLFDDDYNLVATGSCFANTLRCMAVSSEHQGEGLMNQVISHLIEYQYSRGNTSLFLYTKCNTARFFGDLGFYEIARVEGKVVFMENGVVVEEGPSKEFFANPREERTRTFLQNIEQHYE